MIKCGKGGLEIECKQLGWATGLSAAPEKEGGPTSATYSDTSVSDMGMKVFTGGMRACPKKFFSFFKHKSCTFRAFTAKRLGLYCIGALKPEKKGRIQLLQKDRFWTPKHWKSGPVARKRGEVD